MQLRRRENHGNGEVLVLVWRIASDDDAPTSRALLVLHLESIRHIGCRVDDKVCHGMISITLVGRMMEVFLVCWQHYGMATIFPSESALYELGINIIDWCLFGF